MMLVIWMAIGCLGSWLAAMLVAPQLMAEVFFGMLAPFLAVATTWLLIERAARVNPAGVTQILLGAFAVKMVFFGLYVVAVITMAKVDRTPFVLSFTAYFVALYATEALQLRRLSGRLT